MIVLFVSECRKKAFSHTRKVLNKYANQIGRRTWLCKISEEGLKDVQHDLVSGRSSHMSVSCHRIRGKNQTSLEWVVGSKRHFNQQGRFSPFATQKPRFRTIGEKPVIIRILRYTVELAGLFHDLGKSNLFFQKKLLFKKPIADPIRHEYLSLLMLERVIRRRKSSVSCPDEDWLTQLSDPDEVTSLFTASFDQGRVDLDSFDEDIAIRAFEPTADGLFRYPPILTAVFWLILSHHKLPSSKKTNEANGTIISQKNHIHSQKLNQPSAGSKAKGEPKDCEVYQLPDDKLLIWKDRNWTCKIALICKKLRLLLDETPFSLEMNDWITLVAYFGRTALTTGDYRVSSRDDQIDGRPFKKNALIPPKNKSDGNLYANSISIERGTKKRYSQRLSNHLTDVAKNASSFLRLMGSTPSLHFPGILEEDYPVPLTGFAQKDSPFYWQNHACRLIHKARKKGIVEGGFFGILMAGTGSGKTRACAQILGSLSKRLRYINALGLRTLTLQTGKEYRNELKMKEEQLAIVIGSEATARLFQMEQDIDTDGHGSISPSVGFVDFGRESAVKSDDYSGIDYITNPDFSIPPAFDFLDHKKQKLLHAPVLVCTVDQVATVTNGRRSSQLIPGWRIATSDLVLDEVDSYDEESLPALGKLIYLTALFGNKVLVSSATTPPGIARYFYAAYSAGYHLHCKAFAKEPTIFAGWFSDFYQHSKIELMTARKDENRFFTKAHEEAVGGILGELEKTKPRRFAGIVEIDGKRNEAELFATIFEACKNLHRKHSIEYLDKRLSVGLVRWSNIRPCWRFSEYLYNLDEDAYELRLVCYHSRHLLISLQTIEATLNRILNRKYDDNDTGNDPIFKHKEIKDILAETGKKDVMIIVVASPIEEVGRDHDFDWAVIEPSSTRAIIQCAGRVLRHRALTPNSSNITLMSTSYRKAMKLTELEEEYDRYNGGSRAISRISFAYPGVEDGKTYKLSSFLTKEVYHFELLKTRIDASLQLQVPDANDSEITHLEHAKIEHNLKGHPNLSNVSLLDFIGIAQLKMSDYHPRVRPLRKPESSILIWCDEELEEWKRLGRGIDEHHRHCRSMIKKQRFDKKAARRSLIPLADNIAEEFEKLATSSFREYDSNRQRQLLLGVDIPDYLNDKLFDYYPELGFCLRKD